MSKSTLSTTVNTEIITILDKWGNKSQIVNRILTNALQTEEGITELIEDTKITLERLEKIKERIKEKQKKQFKNISRDLKNELMGYKETVGKDTIEHYGVKSILKKNPDKLVLWTGVINRKYGMALNPEQLKSLIKRLSKNVR